MGWGRRALRVAAVMAMTIGGLSSADMPATAQTRTDTAFSSTHGELGSWSVAWDSDDWTKNEDAAEGTEIDLILERDGTFVHFYEVVDAADAATCLADIVPFVEGEIGLTDSEPLLDDDGEPVGLVTDINSREVRTVSGEVGGDDFDGFGYSSCWEIEAGETAIFATAVTTAAAAEDDLPLLDDLFAEVRTYVDGEEITGDATGDATPEPANRDEDATATGADEDAGTYVSPTFGFSTAWDPDAWTVERESVSEDGADRDLIRLDETDGSSILFFEGGTTWDGDLDECLTQLLTDLDVDPDEAEPLEDPETGDAFAIDDDDRLAAGYLGTLTRDNDDEIVSVVYVVACERLDDDLIVGVSHVSDEDERYFTEDYPLFEEILDNTAAPGTDDAPDGTGTPDAAATSTGDGASGAEGLGSYLSPTYGYTLEWDPAYWMPLGQSSGGGTDVLTLVAADLFANVVGYETVDGDIETCLDDFIAITQEESPDAAILDGDDGPGVTTSDDGRQLTALVAAPTGDGVEVSFVYCVAIADGAAVRLSITGDADALDAESDAIDTLVAGLVVPPAG